MDDMWSTTYGLARSQGVPEWQLRSAPWDHPYWGVVRAAGIDGGDPDVRIADALALAGPRDLLTGWAAARGHGVRYMDGRDWLYRPIPVSVVSTARGQHRPQTGLHPTRRSVHEHEMTTIGRARAVTLARAAYDLALDAPNLREAIVAIDMCVSTALEQGRTTINNIDRLMSQHTKTRGIVQARKALSLACSRVASPWETRTRYVAQVLAGIQSLEVNVPVFDLDGRLAGIADLFDSKAGYVVEYDGADHREVWATAGDNVREEGFEMLGIFVSRVVSVDHRDERALAQRLGTARLHVSTRSIAPRWTTEKPDWWSSWPPARRWD